MKQVHGRILVFVCFTLWGCILERVPTPLADGGAVDGIANEVQSSCGDGVLLEPEECDDGVDNSDTRPNACRASCVRAACGDGVVDDEEQCDLGAENSNDAGAKCTPECEVVTRFVSLGTFPGIDLADLSGRSTDVVGSTADFDALVNRVFDDIAAQSPEFVISAGNLVRGRWHEDAEGDGVFGTYDSFENTELAVHEAASVYYSSVQSWFSTRELELLSVPGPNDLGGAPWPPGSTQARLVPLRRSLWTQYFNSVGATPRFDRRPVGTQHEFTTFATQRGNVLLLGIDTSRFEGAGEMLDSENGAVTTDLSDELLDWVTAEVMESENVNQVVVFGNAPLVPLPSFLEGPPAISRRSGERLAAIFAALGVDLYLSDALVGVVGVDEGYQQLAHGGQLGRAGDVSYLVIDAFPDRIEIQVRSASIRYEAEGLAPWQSDGLVLSGSVSLEEFSPVGSMTINTGADTPELMHRDGALLPITEAAEDLLAIHLDMDEVASGGIVRNRGLTGLNNNLVLENGAEETAGVLGGAVHFDAGQFGVAGSYAFGDQARSVSLWFRSTQSVASQGTTGLATLFSVGRNQAGRKFEVDIQVTDASESGLGVGIGFARVDSSSPTNLNDGEWHIATITFAGGGTLEELGGHIDGVEVLDPPTADRPIETEVTPMRVARETVGSLEQAYVGDIDDVAVWSRALSSGEVRLLESAARQLGYTAQDCNRLLVGFHRRQSVILDERLWRYVPSDVIGVVGALSSAGDGWVVHLGDGSGMESR